MSDRMEFRGAQGDLEIYIPSHSLWKSKLQSWHPILLADMQCEMGRYKVNCHLLTTREDRWTEWQVTSCTTIRNSTEIYCFTSYALKVQFTMWKDKHSLALHCALYIKTKVKQIQQFSSNHRNTGDDCTVSLNPRSHTFTSTGSNGMNKSRDSLWITRKWNTRESLPSTNWLWPSGGDEQVPPSPPQLMEWDQWRQWSVRRNWCGHQVQDSLTARLAWAPFDCRCTSKTPPYLCETVLFLQPLRGIHRWQKSPKWPYQLFYYFSHGGAGGRQGGRKHIFSSKIRWESLPPLGGLKLSDYAKPWEMSLTQENVNKGSFDHAAEVTFTPRSFF